MQQYYVITVSDDKMNVVYFNFGVDKENKYKETESYYGNSGISITVYKHNEFSEFKEHYTDLLNDCNAALINVK